MLYMKVKKGNPEFFSQEKQFYVFFFFFFFVFLGPHLPHVEVPRLGIVLEL